MIIRIHTYTFLLFCICYFVSFFLLRRQSRHRFRILYKRQILTRTNIYIYILRRDKRPVARPTVILSLLPYTHLSLFTPHSSVLVPSPRHRKRENVSPKLENTFCLLGDRDWLRNTSPKIVSCYCVCRSLPQHET